MIFVKSPTLAQLLAPPLLTMPAKSPLTISPPPLSPCDTFSIFNLLPKVLAVNLYLCLSSISYPCSKYTRKITHITGAFFRGPSTKDACCEVESVFLHVCLAFVFINYWQLKPTELAK